MIERVLVAMSGGVDSSVAAAIVVEKGFEAVGLTLHLAGEASRCCSLADAEDARRVARQLGMRHFVANHQAEFRAQVMQPFADAYLAGRTPNPCVLCNKQFKFRALIARARALGASRVASGHFARVDRDPESGLYRLRRALDRNKDQTYFLFQLGQSELAHCWFPVGEMSKQEIRARARALGLASADKPESVEICFVPDGDYAAVVEALKPSARDRGGDFVDAAGRKLGRHRGIHRYTIGQRRGLGLSAVRPLYVRSIDPVSRRIELAEDAALGCLEAWVEQVCWLAGEPPVGPQPLQVQVRHRHDGASASVEPLPGGRVHIRFEAPVRAVAPGQAAVFYRGDSLLGGGWIAAEAG